MGREPDLRALLVSPSRTVAEQFAATLAETRAFQIVANLQSYPAPPVLETRLRQLKPDVLLLDLATDLEAALQLIPYAAAFQPPVQVLGLHVAKDPDALIRSLRVGASEFLHAPFDVATQRDAIARLRRLRQPEGVVEREAGRVIALASSKPGSGASTLAVQLAFALRRRTGRRVLLGDLDMMGGAATFFLKVVGRYSLLDALRHADELDAAAWASLTVHAQGVDLLAAPDTPYAGGVDAAGLHKVLENARQLYDWIVLDLPTVFHQVSLTALSEADQGFMVTTSELPSLHLTRKAVTLLGQLGVDRDRYRVVVNRWDRRDGMVSGDLQKLFGAPVHSTLPNDYLALHRAVTLGEPLGSEGELGRAIDGLAGQLGGTDAGQRKGAAGLVQTKAALSQT